MTTMKTRLAFLILLCALFGTPAKAQNGFRLQASASHTLVRARGGYTRVEDCLGQVVKASRGDSLVVENQGLATLPVYRLTVDGSHSYETDSIFSLE
ncbi:MAG: hypothetical protein WA876_11200 [Candidatus Acidiferrales bacterium]